jgi:hypothetical protein
MIEIQGEEEMRNLFFLILVISVVAGCESNTPPQTVEWYKTHSEERQSMLGKCKASPGDQSLLPDCVNARQAENEIKNARRGWIKPEPINFDEKE